MKVLHSFTYKNKYFVKGANLPANTLPAGAVKEAIEKGLIEKPKAKKAPKKEG